MATSISPFPSFKDEIHARVQKSNSDGGGGYGGVGIVGL